LIVLIVCVGGFDQNWQGTGIGKTVFQIQLSGRMRARPLPVPAWYNTCGISRFGS
jgi:hypothetical protein